MDALWEGVLAGYGIAIPVGAIAILIVSTAMQRGFRVGFMAGAGAATADLLFAALAAFTGQVLADALLPYESLLRAASAVLLMGLGAYGLWKLSQPAAVTSDPAVSASGEWRTYGQFLGLTLLNPLTIAYFAALILGRGAAVAAENRALFVIGAAAASLSWQSLLAVIGALARRHLSPRFRLLTSIVGHSVVILLGLRIML